ncbi:MAG: hypothetical protein NW703_10905 [Nitrospiraceae bacterium]
MRNEWSHRFSAPSVGLVALLLFTNCTHFTSPAREHELKSNQGYWFDYEASRRGTLLIIKDSADTKQVTICAEPPPDIALERSQEILAKVSYQNIPAELQAKLGEKVAELGKRTQTVMFLRESLFRLCELSNNSTFSSDSLKVLYEKVIDAALAVAEAEKADAERPKAEAERTKALQAFPEDIQRRLVQ